MRRRPGGQRSTSKRRAPKRSQIRRARKRPFILVLAGVNGAGKSSVAGDMLKEHGVPWFNPDAYARELIQRLGCTRDEADAEAWASGKRRLEAALAEGTDYAFETTLGGATISRLLVSAAATHHISMIYCGLDSIEKHMSRVRLRVEHGGHDIPEERIRARWSSSRENLVALLPHLFHLQVFDNSVDVAPGEPVPDPKLILEMKQGVLLAPALDDAEACETVPDWAKPVVAAAFRLHKERSGSRHRRSNPLPP
ncbi:MAG TPA: AAA family ATPase [Stellaceae bacterium]|nr:AAA family ATPase [Stellaceae bacterium]